MNKRPNTLKFRDFVKFHQLEMKPVTYLPGIGPVLGQQLNKHGCKHACELVEKFLKMRKDLCKFEEWLWMACPSANSRHIHHCVASMNELCRYLK